MASLPPPPPFLSFFFYLWCLSSVSFLTRLCSLAGDLSATTGFLVKSSTCLQEPSKTYITLMCFRS